MAVGRVEAGVDDGAGSLVAVGSGVDTAMTSGVGASCGVWRGGAVDSGEPPSHAAMAITRTARSAKPARNRNVLAIVTLPSIQAGRIVPLHIDDMVYGRYFNLCHA